MVGFVVQALDPAIVEAAAMRFESGDPYVRKIQVDAPIGYPCRVTLEWAKPGESVLLFKHGPISAPSPYAEEGPVFARLNVNAKILPVGALPDYVRDMQLVSVRGYDETDAIACAEPIAGAKCIEAVARAFARQDIAYVHVRAAAHGCYQFRVERAG